MSEAIPFFSTTGNHCPRNYNPSDFFLDVLSPDSRTPEVNYSIGLSIGLYLMLSTYF